MSETVTRDREKVLDLVRGMPEDSTYKKIREELEIHEAIEEGIADKLAGRTYSHEAILAEFVGCPTN